MKACEQTKGQSVHQHGLSVYAHLLDLIDYLNNNRELPDWRIPDWLDDYSNEIKSQLLPLNILKEYTIYHDCGKPLCRTVDEEGKAHFPNHAKISHDTWLEAGGDPQVAKLMLHDMWIHTMKAKDIDEFIKHPEAISWLVVGLCEVHSNCRMFGGKDSVSFKSKWRQIERRGKAICKKLFKEKD